MWRLKQLPKKSQNHRQLFFFSLTVLLFTIADGMVAFFMPLLAKQILVSMALVGVVLASSSAWNIVADLFLGFKGKQFGYRTLARSAFLLMIAMLVMNLAPLPINFWLGVTVLLATMMIWGFYYEAMIFSIFNFVVVTTDKGEQARSFGVIEVFQYLGYVLGPALAGLLLMQGKTGVLGTTLFFSLLGMVFFIFRFPGKNHKRESEKPRKLHLRAELKVWHRIGKKIFPVLLVTAGYGVYYGVVSSLTPIFVESKTGLAEVGGFIVAAFYLPMILFTGWFGNLADNIGRKRFIVLGLILMAAALIGFGRVGEPLAALALAFTAGIGLSLLFPSLSAEHSAYIEDHTTVEKQALGEMGTATNLGFIFGVVVSGLLVSVTGGFSVAYTTSGGILLACAFFYSRAGESG